METPVRVLLLTTYYFPFQGGVETHARTLASDLTVLGLEVSIVTRRVDRSQLARDIVEGVPVHRVWPVGPRTGLLKWMMLPFAAAKIVRLRRTFDLIYCPGYQGIGVAAIACAKLLGKPVVLRSGNLGVLYGNNWNAPLARFHIPADSWAVRQMKAAVRRVYLSADALVCTSKGMVAEALACGMPADRVHWLPNGVDVDRYHPADTEEKRVIREHEHWSAGALVCLYLGRLSREKGVLDRLEAWRQVRRDHELLVLVGPDAPGNALDAGVQARDFIARHQMHDHVILHGSSDSPGPLLRAADVYVQPSHYEAFSNSVLEAMATGLPILVTRVGGMLDVVVNDQNGLLCEPQDPLDLGRQLRRLMDDAALRKRLGDQARVTVVRRFDTRSMVRQFAALFTATVLRSRAAS